MKTEERREKIYHTLKTNKEIPVSVLAKRFGVSSMTIRRDLTFMEETGLIDRSYGKARIVDETRREFSFGQRSQTNRELKEKIARTMLGYMGDISSFYVDGSTTAIEVLRILPSGRPYTVFTDSFESLKLLSGMSWIRTYVMGGFLNMESSSFDDDMTDTVKRIYVDATITSCSGFSQNGIFNDGIIGIQAKRVMLGHSAKNFILADHTKADSQGLFLLSSWEQLHYLVTDCQPDRRMLENLIKNGVQVVW